MQEEERLSDAKSKRLVCTQPGFITRYFETSRLHHISTWKADLTDYVLGKIQDNASTYRSSSPTEPFRTVMHVDMDCFFASVGVRNRPDVADKPVAVAHSVGGVQLDYSTSEIASCNYLARNKGIKNGIFIGSAKQLAPDLIIVPYSFDDYDICSKELYNILLQSADYVQAVSCDEAYIDITFKVQKELYNKMTMQLAGRERGREGDGEGDVEEDSWGGGGGHYFTQHPEKHSEIKHALQELQRTFPSQCWAVHDEVSQALAQDIRAQVRRATGGCNASVGIGSNLLLARLATAKAKPNGQHVLMPHMQYALAFLQQLPISSLPGVGRATSEKCAAQLRIQTCGELLRVKPATLQAEIGAKSGETLYAYASGSDSRVLENKPRQSIGSEINWGVRFETQTQIERFLREFVTEVLRRLRTMSHVITGASHVTVTAKKKLYEGEPGKFLGCGHCADYTRSAEPRKAIGPHDDEALYLCVSSLFAELRLTPTDVRGVGIHLRKLKYKQTRQQLYTSRSGSGGSSGSTLQQSFFTDKATHSPTVLPAATIGTEMSVGATCTTTGSGTGVGTLSTVSVLLPTASNEAHCGSGSCVTSPVISSPATETGVGHKRKLSDSIQSLHSVRRQQQQQQQQQQHVVEKQESKRLSSYSSTSPQSTMMQFLSKESDGGGGGVAASEDSNCGFNQSSSSASEACVDNETHETHDCTESLNATPGFVNATVATLTSISSYSAGKSDLNIGDIDMDVFDALPPDIQQELQAAAFSKDLSLSSQPHTQEGIGSIDGHSNNNDKNTTTTTTTTTTKKNTLLSWVVSGKRDSKNKSATTSSSTSSSSSSSSSSSYTGAIGSSHSLCCPPALDTAVLEALPADIREEQLRHYSSLLLYPTKKV